MFTVIITEKGGDQKRLEFDKPEVTVGRVQGNDIILPKGNVSKRHSRVVLKDGKFIIVNLKSTNGTYVNGRKITSPLVIKGSDKIYIGDYILSVEDEAGASAGAGAGAAAPRRAPPPAPARPGPLPGPLDDDDDGAELADDMVEASDEDIAEEDLPTGAPQSPRMTIPTMAAVKEPPVPSPAPKEPPPASRVPAPLPNPASAPVRDPLAARAAQMGARPPGPAPQVPRPTPAAVPVPSPHVVHRDPPPPAAPVRQTGGAIPAAQPAAARELPPPVSQPPVPAVRESRPVPVPAPQGTPSPAAASPAAAAGAPAFAASRDRDREAPVPRRAPAIVPADKAADPMADKLRELTRDAVDRLSAKLDLGRREVLRLGDEELWQKAESAIVDIVEQLDAEGSIPSTVDQEALIKDVLNEALGLGPLEDLLADDDVSEIHVSGAERLWVEREGRLHRHDKGFSSDRAVVQVIERLVAPLGRKVDDQSPLVNVRLRDGAHLTAAVAPLAVRGPVLTVRKLRRASVSLEDMVSGGELSQAMSDFLLLCLKHRKNLLVSGGTRSGRTTLVAALARALPEGERVISIEDVAEMDLARDQWIALEARPGDLSGRGGVGIAQLLHSALRMRPDRLIVGELTGGETLEVLGAASAHDGLLTSVRAESPRESVARLETMARQSGVNLPSAALHALVASSLQVLVQLVRFADGSRRVASISEVIGSDDSGVTLRELYSFQVQGQGDDGAVRGKHLGAGLVPRFVEELEQRGVSVPPAMFRG